MKEKEQKCRIEQESNPMNTKFAHVYFLYTYISQCTKGKSRQKTALT